MTPPRDNERTFDERTLRTRTFRTRRAVTAALIAGPTVFLGAHAASPRRVATPSQTEGPFYPRAVTGDADADLLDNGGLSYTRGEPAWVEGTVTDLDGNALSGATVEIWQCDAAGHYRHPHGGAVDPAFQGFGRVVVGADGRYRFRTMKPVVYPGRTPHIHFKVASRGRTVLTTQLYVAGESRNAADGIWRSMDEQARAAVTVPFRPAVDGLVATFPIVIGA